MAKNDNNKKTLEVKQVVDAYAILKVANLSKIATTTDKYRVVDALRYLRPVDAEHDATVVDARETLKPVKYDETTKRIRESEELRQVDILRSNILTEAYNEAMDGFIRKEMSREIEVPIIPLGKDCMDKLIEGNPAWTPEQIMTVIDVLG